MKKINFTFPVVVIAISVLAGFYMNYRSGMNWDENVANMSGVEKVVTYAILFVLILVWKNRDLIKKS